MDNFSIKRFTPIYLAIDRVGPFQNGLYEFDITDSNNHPCNIYLLISRNGSGKTTALEVLKTFFSLLDRRNHSSYGMEDFDRNNGKAQVDFLVEYTVDSVLKKAIFSMIIGGATEPVPLRVIDDSHLDSHSVDSWQSMGFSKSLGRTNLSVFPTGDFPDRLLDAVGYSYGHDTGAFTSSLLDLPTAIFFSAYRDIPPIRETQSERHVSIPFHWGYKSLHSFDPHSMDWQDSIDNVLVWLKWIDDGRFDAAVEFINEKIFRDTDKRLSDVNKQLLEAFIQVGDERHRLDRLSSGEKNMLMHFLRITSLMTSNSVILIDEFEVHLHIRWAHKILIALKEFVQENVGCTVIASTHSTEMLDTFNKTIDLPEEGLHKGGNIISYELEQNKD